MRLLTSIYLIWGYILKMEKVFFELLRLAIEEGQRSTDNRQRTSDNGVRTTLLTPLSVDQWREVYQMAVKQTLVGVMFPALERLPEGMRPPKELLLQWYMMKERIVKMNRLLNQRAVETERFFKQEGFKTCILKGQGIATLYQNPLLRTSGDIDIWLSGGRTKIYNFARSRVGLQGVTYQHIHYPLHKDVEVEVHVIPGHLFAPIENRKLQRYFETCSEEQFMHKVELPEGVGAIHVPTDEFNRVYILLHIYGHLFGEGIGLRQVLDYYYVLRQPATAESKARTVEVLRQLKMLRFAGAMMWVMQEVFGLEDEYLLVTPDAKEGRFLLDEIMLAGNFGKYDARIDRKNHHRLLPRLWNSLKRNWKFLVRYPHEMIWDVPFRVWQYGWSRMVR